VSELIGDMHGSFETIDVDNGFGSESSLSLSSNFA
jgi:hypothetical protein